MTYNIWMASIARAPALYSTPLVGIEYPAVKVTVTRGDEILIDALIPVESADGRKSDAIKRLPYIVCATRSNGRQTSAKAHTVRDGASVMVVQTKAGMSLDVVVETASHDVSVGAKACRSAPVSSAIVRQQFILPNDGHSITSKMPGGVTVVAHLR